MSIREEELKLEYDKKYSGIPRDYNERLKYMIDLYNLSEKQMDKIIMRKRAMEYSMEWYDFKVIIWEEPRIKPRPRFRIINRKNFMDAAISNPQFVHVYSPGARDEHEMMHRLLEDELNYLHLFIQTPCTIRLDAYEKTPEAFSVSDKFLAEYGLIPNITHNDYDNILKSTSDRLNANVWLDDSLVCSGTINKLYSILPREEIYIRYLNCAATKLQYNKIVGRRDYKSDFPINYLNKEGYINGEV